MHRYVRIAAGTLIGLAMGGQSEPWAHGQVPIMVSHPAAVHRRPPAGARPVARGPAAAKSGPEIRRGRAAALPLAVHPKGNPAAKQAGPGARPATARPVLPPWFQQPGKALQPGRTPAPVLSPTGGLVPGVWSPMPPLQPVPVNPLIYGVNVVWGDSGGGAHWDKDEGAKAHRLAQLMKAAGVTNTRIGIGWGDVERVRGRYDWRETDRFIRYVKGLGVTPICVVAVTPDWALDRSPETLRLFHERHVDNLAGVRAPEPQYYADLERFAYACAQRYKGTIRHWEFWNEPDGMGMPIVEHDGAGRPSDIRYGGDAKVYTAMLRAFAAGVRRADPTARIAVGGLQVHLTDFLTGIYAHGGRSSFDAVALHPYNGPNPIAFDWIDRCREVLVRHGDTARPFWLTEWGWSTRPGEAAGLTEAHQARLIRESFEGIRARRFITQASYHTLNDWRTDEANPSSLIAMGLCTYSMQPKAGYAAFREAATGIPSEAARSYVRVPLLGSAPLTAADGVRPGVVAVTVDAAAPSEPIVPVWAAFSQGPEPGLPTLLQRVAPRLRTAGTAAVRFDPFPNPDAVRSAPGQPGGITVDWTYPDAVVAALASAGVKPAFAFATMPTSLASDGPAPWVPRDLALWSALVRQTVQRYAQGPGRGAHWELALEPGRSDAAAAGWLRVYEAFAKAVADADPTACVGGPSAGTFDAASLAATAARCSERGVPLHFLSWRTAGTAPADLAKQVRELRERLRPVPGTAALELCVAEWCASGRPSPVNDGLPAALYAVSLAEELGRVGAGPVRTFCYQLGEGSRGTSSAELAGRWGAMAQDGRPKALYNAMRLLSHLRGSALSASSEETGVHVLAARDGSRAAAMLWRDAPAAGERPPSAVQIALHLRGLPWQGASDGSLWQLDAHHGDMLDAPGRPELDAPVRFRTAPGDPEVPLVLAAGSIVLVELTQARPAPPVAVVVSAPAYTAVGGATLPLAVNVSNRGTRPASVVLALSCTDASALPAAGLRSRRVTLAPGSGAVVSLPLRPPASSTGGQEFAQVTASVAGEREAVTAAVALRTVSPLDARLSPARADVLPAGQGRTREAPTAPLRVLMTNKGAQALTVRVSARGQAARVLVPARGVVLQSLPVTSPSAEPGNYPVIVDVQTGGRTVQRLDGVVGVPVTCVRAPRGMRIARDLASWSAAQAIDLDKASMVKDKRWGGPEDLSARILTMWDDANLYLAAVVRDDVHYQPFTPDRMWEGDSVQFALDTRRDAAPDQVGYTPGDFEFGLCLGRQGPEVWRFAGGSGPGPVAAAKASAVRAGDRVIYQVAIPWAALGAKPYAGGVMGFSVVVNDNDGRGRGYMEWPGGIADAKRPGQFVGLRFAP